jgi:hypothetical protein
MDDLEDGLWYSERKFVENRMLMEDSSVPKVLRLGDPRLLMFSPLLLLADLLAFIPSRLK